MILIVDNTSRKMRREIRELLFSLYIPCAVTDTEHIQNFLPCDLIIVTEAYILADVKYIADMYGKFKIVLYDEKEKFCDFVIRICNEHYDIENIPKRFMLEFKGRELNYLRKHILLTGTERRICTFLLYAKDWIGRDILSLYCAKNGAADSKRIAVHICNVNKKVKAATGLNLIEHRRYLGYRFSI